MELLKEFILNHQENWRDILSTDPYNLTFKEKDDLILFKYNQLKSDFNNPIVREARGIVFRKSDWKCVCRAFDKFGNLGEGYVPELDWDTTFVSEKIDGSLIKLYYDGIEWHFGTNNNIDVEDAPLNDAIYSTFGDLLFSILPPFDEFSARLSINYTYMFELVSPYARVVVPYDKTQLFYLGARNMETTQEFTFADYNPFKGLIATPKIYVANNIDELVQAAKKLPWNDEGYVVCDGNFNRCKIKSPAYVLAHHGRNNNVISTRRLWELVLAGEEKEFLIYAEDYTQAIEDVKADIAMAKTLANNWHMACQSWVSLTKKEYAEKIRNHVSRSYQDYCHKLFFNSKLSWEQYTKDWDVYKWLRFMENFGT